MFNPFTNAPQPSAGSASPAIEPEVVPEEDDIETVRRDMIDLQKRLDRLATKE